MYRHLYIYHLEGHAEKTGDHSGIYSKKDLLSFQSHTEKEAHGRTNGGKMGTLATFRVAVRYRGADQGSGLRARSP